MGSSPLSRVGTARSTTRIAAESLEAEAQPLERLAPALEQRARGGAEIERLGEEQRLRGQRPARASWPRSRSKITRSWTTC